jgi:lysophospholipase L1-like esterase
MQQNYQLNTAPSRLKDLIDSVLRYTPKAAIFVCQIVPLTVPALEDRIVAYNSLIPDIVTDFANRGYRVSLVRMYDVLTTSDIGDHVHPNDGGYVKMANTYYAAIQEADAKGWITNYLFSAR